MQFVDQEAFPLCDEADSSSFPETKSMYNPAKYFVKFFLCGKRCKDIV